jgi:hypothetical protein
LNQSQRRSCDRLRNILRVIGFPRQKRRRILSVRHLGIFNGLFFRDRCARNTGNIQALKDRARLQWRRRHLDTRTGLPMLCVPLSPQQPARNNVFRRSRVSMDGRNGEDQVSRLLDQTLSDVEERAFDTSMTRVRRLGTTSSCWSKSWRRIVSRAWCIWRRGTAFWRHGPGGSAGDWREAHGRIIAQRGDGFQRQVAAALDGPLVVLFEQDGADQTGDGVLVWERCRSLRFCA